MTDSEILQAMAKMLEPIHNKLTSLEAGQAKLEAKVERIQTKVDHDISGLLTTVVEQHMDIVAKLDAIADYPETKGRVSTLEHVVKAHTDDIAELKKKAV